MNSLYSTLADLGFVPNRNCGMVWGVGSLMWGKTIHVVKRGKTFEVKTNRWLYNCEGDCVYDETSVTVLGRHADVVSLIQAFRRPQA